MMTRLLLLTLFVSLPLPRAEALPALFFDGIVTYDHTTEILAVDGDIAHTQELPLSTILPGSHFRLRSHFTSVATSDAVVAILGPLPGSTTEVEVTDAGGVHLLLADLSSAELAGPPSWDLGRLLGEVVPMGGTVAGDFTNPSTLFALTLNLTTPFDAQMFGADFGGVASGRIQAVTSAPSASHAIPEPATLVLLALGLSTLFATRHAEV